MKTKQKLYALVASLFIIFGASPSLAAGNNLFPDNDINMLPSIFARDIKLAPDSSGSVVKGSFSLINGDNKINGDLKYEIFLIDKDTSNRKFDIETYATYDRVVSTDKFTLKPNETQEVSFSYNPPLVPKGDYRIRIRVITSAGLELGWADQNITTGTDMGFLYVVPKKVVAGTDGQPMDGINVDPGQEVSFSHVLINKWNKKVVATPVLTTYEWDQTGKKLSEDKGEPVTVLPGKRSTELSFKTTAKTKPTSYYVSLAFVDSEGNIVSTVSEYRYVVKGESAHIASSNVMEAEPGQVKVVTVVAGPADRTTTVDNAKLLVSLLDSDKNVVGQAEQKPLKLDADAIFTVTSVIPFGKNLEKYGLKAELMDQNGKILDSYQYATEGVSLKAGAQTTAPIVSEKNGKNYNVVILATIAVVLVLIVALLIIFVVRKRHDQSTVLMKSIVIGIICSGLALSGLYAKGQGSSRWYMVSATPYTSGGSVQLNHGVSVFVNNPVDNSNFSNHSVYFAMDLLWQSCNNRDSQAWLYIDQYTASGHITPIQTPNVQREWLPEEAVSDILVRGEGREAPPYMNLKKYDGTRVPDAGSGRWSMLYSYKTPAANYGDAIAKSTRTGFLNINAGFTEATIRYLVFKKHITSWQGWVNGNGYFAWLNFYPQPTCSPTTQNANTGAPVSFTASGGTAPYNWTTTGGTPSSASNTASFTTTYSTNGAKTATITDSNGQSGSCTANISYPAFACSAVPNQTTVGTPVTFSTTGGNTSLANYYWRFSDNTTGTGSSTSKSFTSAGAKTAVVTHTSVAEPAGCYSGSDWITYVVKMLQPNVDPASNVAITAKVLDNANGIKICTMNGFNFNSKTSEGWTGTGKQIADWDSATGTWVTTAATALSRAISTLDCQTNCPASVASETTTCNVTVTNSVTCAATPNPTTVGTAINFSASGGTAPFTWVADGATQGSTTSTLSKSFASTGTKSVTVTDSTGGVGTCSAIVTAAPIPIGNIHEL